MAERRWAPATDGVKANHSLTAMAVMVLGQGRASAKGWAVGRGMWDDARCLQLVWAANLILEILAGDLIGEPRKLHPPLPDVLPPTRLPRCRFRETAY